MKIVTVVGNRPQFIKSAPLSAALRKGGIEEIVVHTGQHWDATMSQIFFEELELNEPKITLDLRTSEIGRLEEALRATISGLRPDMVLVYGDTNSTLAGARASVTAPVAHIEAGLRSGDLTMPEERNRIEVDSVSAVLFAPDERSAATLREENVAGEIHVVGDVMADAVVQFAPLARERSGILDALDLEPGAYVLATVHREANVQPERLARIVAGLGGSSRPVVFAAHPRTRSVLAAHEIEIPSPIIITDALGYLDFAALASQAAVIATDSGGLQKEAYWYGVPCVTMRPSTEWIDTVYAGANVLVDDDPARIAAAIGAARMPTVRPTLYGDGHASERIATVLGGTIARCAS
ncbi:UDP-N-acetylglucosamine 2-epimerase (non-hydrolyzing) [Gaiella sp.]|uniref:non-hydrolyzing UDP-N-acetylglucosamine 2-epimerase n=1 Tax=Gaiella sp. TaxID=2663207 RepID=UPI003263D52D